MQNTLKSSTRKKLSYSGEEARLLRELANMPDKGSGRFRKDWGRLYGSYSDDQLLTLRDELRALWNERRVLHAGKSVRRGEDKPFEWMGRGFSLRIGRLAGTEPPPEKSVQQRIVEKWLSQEKQFLMVEWTQTSPRVHVDPQSLPAVVAALCMEFADRLFYCCNVDCSTPCFVGRRHDQKYCSRSCKALDYRPRKRDWARKSRAATKAASAASGQDAPNARRGVNG